MIQITYPAIKPAIKEIDGKECIFCIIRKRWFTITPEEWVRQNFLLFLINELLYPSPLIAVEKQLQLADVKKRFDIIVYKDAIPYIIVECKEMNVPLSESTLRQVLNYNTTIQASIMIITNGTYCRAFEKRNNQFLEMDFLPFFKAN